MAAMVDGNPHHSNRLTNLDGLRGVAIVMVVLFHTYSRWTHLTPWSETPFQEEFFSYGWLGVNLFFIVSGFVIFWSLDKSANFINFAIKRWLRLFPAMLLASGLIFTTASLIPERPSGLPSIRDVWPGLLFVQPGLFEYLFDRDFRALDGAFWSLFVEVKFYFISAVAYFFLKDKNGIIVSTIFVFYTLISVLVRYYNADIFEYIHDACIILDFNYFGWFACGIFFYKYWFSSKKIYYASSILCAVASTVTEMADRADAYVLLFGILIYMIFVISFYNNVLSRLFSSKVMLFFGFISYPLYLIHQNLIVGMGIKLHFLFSQIDYTWYSITPLILVIGASFVITNMESFIKHFLQRFLNRALATFNWRSA